MMTFKPASLICVCILMAGFFAAPNSVSAQLLEVSTDRVIVYFDEDVSEELLKQRGSQDHMLTGRAAIDEAFHSRSIHRMEPVFFHSDQFDQRQRAYGLHRWYTVYYNDSKNPHEMAEELMSIQGVSKAEPDHRAHLHQYIPKESIWDTEDAQPSAGSNDPEFSYQWHYHNTGNSGGTPGADISLVPAWEITAGTPDVVVQVLDSGYDVNHPDLADMLWVNPAPGSNGPPGDFHGWNFVTTNGNVADQDGHGTHVAGTIAAQNNNGIGVAGVAGGTGNNDGARIMVARIFEGNPNESSAGAGANGIAQAIVYGANNGAVISNNSWGYTSPGVFPDVIRTAIDYFIEFAGYDEDGNITAAMGGGVFISSAGNTPDQGNYYPAAYEPVVSVAATNHNDQKAPYSNYNNRVDISAPGGQMTGQAPQGGVYSTSLIDVDGFSFLQGTSMASPHVSGVAALIVSHFPGLTNEELITRLINTADFIDDINPSQYAGGLGSGRVNAYRALTETPPPGRAKLVFPEHQSEEQETRFTFNWNEAPLASTYDFQLSRNATFSNIISDKTGITGTSAGSGNLDIETTYYWRVRAHNSQGIGQWSPTSSFKTGSIVSINGDDANLPTAISLHQNYPNPFNPTTQISYSLTEPADVSLSVYNISGQRVATLHNGQQQAGTHRATFNGNGLASGVYIYQLRTSEMILNRKMMLVK